MTPYILTAIRWAAATAVAYAASLVAHLGWHLSVDQLAAVTAAIVGIITPIYYNLIAALEQKFPWLGHLLIVRKPSAQPAAKPAAS